MMLYGPIQGRKITLILVFGVRKTKLSLLALVPLQRRFSGANLFVFLVCSKCLSGIHMCFPELFIEPSFEFVVGNFVTRCFRELQVNRVFAFLSKHE